MLAMEQACSLSCEMQADDIACSGKVSIQRATGTGLGQQASSWCFGPAKCKVQQAHSLSQKVPLAYALGTAQMMQLEPVGASCLYGHILPT